MSTGIIIPTLMKSHIKELSVPIEKQLKMAI